MCFRFPSAFFPPPVLFAFPLKRTLHSQYPTKHHLLATHTHTHTHTHTYVLYPMRPASLFATTKSPPNPNPRRSWSQSSPKIQPISSPVISAPRLINLQRSQPCIPAVDSRRRQNSECESDLVAI
ncbi:hypothetical protein BDZ45DRAFT_682111 [Acephala macrosclerotiorum]|nr:hypothetical protein BDZ45DRAFT_682111 [Acephala macrosclerotiorum]